MLISCPACPKMYRVPASAIPPEGREVSCSACGTVWYERGIEAEVVSVGASAFSASVATTAKVYHAPPKSPSRPKPTFSDVAADSEMDAGKNNVVALWDGKRVQPDWDEVSDPEPIASDEGETPKPQAADAPEDAPHPTAEETAQAAAEVASFFTSEKWEARLPSFGSLKSRFEGWREARSETSLSEGTSAALKFRDRIRAMERNRLTPMRRVGWTALIAALSIMIVVLSDREMMEDVWPDSAKTYAALFGAKEVPRPLDLMDVTTRYAQSIEGPVLEIRGTVINNGTLPIVPLLELRVDNEVLTNYDAVPLTEVSVPVRGERPFVVRAMVPEGTIQAEIRLLAEASGRTGEMEGFILQQTGTGWGDAILPPLPHDAMKSVR